MRRAPALLFCGLLGCGYHFTAGGPSLAGGTRPIFVPMAVNKTSEAGLEVVFTEALREQLGRTGALGGENSPAHVDAEILAVSAAPAVLASSSAARPNQALSYRVTVVLLVKLYRGSELLTQTVVSGFEDYLQGQRPDVLTAESNRVAALKRLATDLSRDAYVRLAGAG